MDKKKAEKKTSALQISKREPGKALKTNFMKNLRDFPSLQQSHPVEDLIFPKTEPVSDLDTQIKSSGHSEEIILDTQIQQQDAPKEEIIEHPTVESLDTQFEPAGHPDTEILGVWAPKKQIQAPRKSEVLGAQTPKSKNSGHSKNSNWRKYDQARSTIRVNLHIDKEIDKKVRQYCFIDAPEKIELKEFYERAAINLLSNLDTQKEGSLGALAPYDDRRLMIHTKSTPSLINLYLVYNSVFNPKTKWSVKDDEAGAKFNDSDIRLVELGLIQTHFNRAFRPGKINSFGYYVNQIQEMLEMEFADETIETMLKINRANWSKATKRELDLEFLKQR